MPSDDVSVRIAVTRAPTSVGVGSNHFLHARRGMVTQGAAGFAIPGEVGQWSSCSWDLIGDGGGLSVVGYHCEE